MKKIVNYPLILVLVIAVFKVDFAQAALTIRDFRRAVAADSRRAIQGTLTSEKWKEKLKEGFSDESNERVLASDTFTSEKVATFIEDSTTDKAITWKGETMNYLVSKASVLAKKKGHADKIDRETFMQAFIEARINVRTLKELVSVLKNRDSYNEEEIQAAQKAFYSLVNAELSNIQDKKSLIKGLRTVIDRWLPEKNEDKILEFVLKYLAAFS